MQVISTVGKSPAISYREAIIGPGYAPDGGLYLPGEIPAFTLEEIEALRPLTLPQRAARIMGFLLQGSAYEPAALNRMASRAFRFPIPTRRLPSGLYVCERFHGPMDAFKDEGIGWLAASLEEEFREHPRIIIELCNTSGDTGGSGAHAFVNVNGVWCIIIYQGGHVSGLQEYDIASYGRNIVAVRSGRNFDHNDRLISRALQDPELACVPLSTLNSKNIGRLLAQVVAYFNAYLDATSPGEEVDVVYVVPSGNLGNLVAAIIAKMMGLPIYDIVAACNTNSPLPEYLETGEYRPRPEDEVEQTLSTAMDVGNPSNFGRLSALFDFDAAKMEQGLVAFAITDEETTAAIRETYEGEDKYLSDPHTAVAIAAVRTYVRDYWDETQRPIRPVVMATAAPCKFGSTINSIVGFEPPVRESARDWRETPLVVTELPDGDYNEFRDLILATYGRASRALATRVHTR